MPKTRANSLDLHYITAGDGPDVVMVHGFLGNLALWHLQIVPHLRIDFRVTTYDLRGHGYSDVPETGYTAGDMAVDLKGLLDSLGIERPMLVGHSFGADICLYFALRYPARVDRVAALEPGLAALLRLRQQQDWPGWDTWVDRLEEVGVRVPPERRTDVEFLLQLSMETPRFYGPSHALPRNREPLLRLIRETSLLRDYEEVGDLTEENIARIKTPTLLVCGQNSHFLSSYFVLRERLPNRRAVLLSGGEHFGPLEQPEVLTELLLEFLSEPLPRSPALSRSATVPH